LGQIRPDPQTLLFSATMPRKIQRLVADALTNPVHITVRSVVSLFFQGKQCVSSACYANNMLSISGNTCLVSEIVEVKKS
jgi:hypothetical protein